MTRKKIHVPFIVIFIIASMLYINNNVWAYDFSEGAKGTFFIGAAYSTHLFMHELGHHIVAGDVGGKSLDMRFFTRKNGNFYFGLSSAKGIPKESKLSYAAGGDRMAGYTFEYALQSYRQKPTTFNKALMFFSGADFLFYTAFANYYEPDKLSYDPNRIRHETGCSKDMLLGIVAAKTFMNAYRVMNEDANFIPYIMVNKTSASFMVKFIF